MDAVCCHPIFIYQTTYGPRNFHMNSCSRDPVKQDVVASHQIPRSWRRAQARHRVARRRRWQGVPDGWWWAGGACRVVRLTGDARISEAYHRARDAARPVTARLHAPPTPSLPRRCHPVPSLTRNGSGSVPPHPPRISGLVDGPTAGLLYSIYCINYFTAPQLNYLWVHRRTRRL